MSESPELAGQGDAPHPAPVVTSAAKTARSMPVPVGIRHVTSPAVPSAPSILDYLYIVLSHWIIVLTVAVLIVAFAWTRIRSAIPYFAAQASIRMVDVRPAMTGGLGVTNSDNVPGTYVDPIMTQIQVMRSRAVAAAAIDSFGLRLRTTVPGFYTGYFTGISVAPTQAAETLMVEFSDSMVTASNGHERKTVPYRVPLVIGGVVFTTPTRPASSTGTLVVPSRDEAIDNLLKSLNATPREMTSVIDIVIQAPDPYWAQRAANAIAATLRQTSALDAQRASRARRAFIEKQLERTDSTLRAREGAVASHQRGQQALSVRDRFSQERTRISSLDQRIGELQTSVRILTTVLEQLEKRDVASRQTIRNLAYSTDAAIGVAIAQQAADLIRLDRARDSLTSGAFVKTSAHPDVQRVDALISAAEGRLAAAIRGQTASLNASLAASVAERSRSAGSIAQLPGAEEEENYLVRERDNVRKMAEKLEEELQLAQISEAVEAGQIEVMDFAQLGAGPLGAGRKRKLLFAALLGVLAGGLAAIGVDRLKRSIRSEEDLETNIGVPCLAVIRRFDTGGPAPWRQRLAALIRKDARGPVLGVRELVLVSDPTSGAAESYRALVTNLLFGTGTGPMGALAITSAIASEGKTTTAANLAVAFAQQGRRVVLVDADLRRARLHETFESARDPGLTSVLLGTTTLAEALSPQFVERLTLLPAGPSTARPLEILASSAMQAVLRELRTMYDVVIVDTPPVLAAADASSLVGQVDGTLLVVRAGRTDRDAARRAAQQVVAVGGYVIGAVLNDADRKLGSYGYYYGQYRYSNQLVRA